MMKLKQLTWMTGLVAALASTSAYSQQYRESGDVYFGGGLGYYTATEAEDELQQDLDTVFGSGTVQTDVDDGALGWSVYGGFAVSDGVALEAGYLGSTDLDVDLRWQGGTARANWSTSAFYAAVVAHIPMRHGAAAHPFLKAGIARWDADVRVSLDIDGDPETISADDDGTDPLLGVGVDIPGFGALSFRGEYLLLWIDDVDGGLQHRFQAGVNYRF